MYEWFSNFELFKVPKTLITKNPKYNKTKRKIKGLKHEFGKTKATSIIIMTTRMCNFVNIMVNQMYYNMKTLFLL